MSLKALASAFNATANSTAYAASAAGMPVLTGDPHTLISTIISLAALRDWLKLFVVGGLLEWCRRYFFTFRDWVVGAFWITATFEANDESYRKCLPSTSKSTCSPNVLTEWVLYWLSHHPVWDKARMVAVSTRDFGLANAREDDDNETCHKISYLPSMDNTYSIWYKRHYMTVSREEKKETAWSTKECLSLG